MAAYTVIARPELLASSLPNYSIVEENMLIKSKGINFLIPLALGLTVVVQPALNVTVQQGSSSQSV